MPGRRRRRRYRRYDDDDYPRYRRGVIADISHFFSNVFSFIIIVAGSIVTFCLLLLIVFNFALFVTILVYALYILAFLAVLGLIYLVIRIITAISQRISATSAAGAKAKLEHERVRQAQVQARFQQAKLNREDYAFYQKYQDRQSPRRTQILHAEPYNYLPAPEGQNVQSPRRTRVLREVGQAAPVQGPPDIPHVTQLIGSAIIPNQKEMLYGFKMINSTFSAVCGDWPGTAIIAGRSGSGKTRRVIIMLLQAILAGQQITICDPHSYKPDGLINILAPFAPWLRFARTDEEIIAAAKEHIAEFESRLTPTGSRNGEGLRPRLIIFDEFSAIMKSEVISNENKRVVAKCVRESATQYRGLGGSAWIMGQEFTEDALFDTAIRKGAHAILCHQLSDEYVRFLFPRDLPTQRLIQKIARRECVYKDSDNVIRRISTPTVLDEEIPTLVAYLERVCPARPRSVGVGNSKFRRPAPISSTPRQSRQFGAPAVEEQRQQNLIPRRTHLVRNQTVVPPQTAPVPRPQVRVQSSHQSAQATPGLVPPTPQKKPHTPFWEEEINVPSEGKDASSDSTARSRSRRPPPDTEELKHRSAASEPERLQDTLEMLAMMRANKKKK